jgi:hypothetical protein
MLFSKITDQSSQQAALNEIYEASPFKRGEKVMFKRGTDLDKLETPNKHVVQQ